MGALFTAGMLRAANAIDDEVRDHLFDIAKKKLSEEDTGTFLAWLRIIVSAFLGNWLVGMAAWNGMSGYLMCHLMACSDLC